MNTFDKMSKLKIRIEKLYLIWGICAIVFLVISLSTLFKTTNIVGNLFSIYQNMMLEKMDLSLQPYKDITISSSKETHSITLSYIPKSYKYAFYDDFLLQITRNSNDNSPSIYGDNHIQKQISKNNIKNIVINGTSLSPDFIHKNTDFVDNLIHNNTKNTIVINY